MSEQILQSIVFPPPDNSAPGVLYVRGPHARHQQGNEVLPGIAIPAAVTVDFATYYNQFSVTRWRHYTNVQSLHLAIVLSGDVELEFVVHNPRGREISVTREHLSAEEPTRLTVALPPIADLPEGLLSFKLIAERDTLIWSAQFATHDIPGKDVSIGICITAFRRDEYVLPALERLSKDLLQLPEFENRIQLVVVDNGNTLSGQFIPRGCKLIENRNLGGAGGFARGLTYYMRASSPPSHCLFMDDDASCEVEAIKRTFSFLSYARHNSLAIAGAMMLEQQPEIQHESGANFDFHCSPVKNGLDLTRPDDLLKNDKIEPFMYGAWWYFAFPLAKVNFYPFPFFVRGDDVAFSLANKFELATLNGICSLQESFAWKESPLTVYLDTRHNSIQYLLFQNLRFPQLKILIKFWRTFIRFSSAYQYASAQAACVALEDVLRPAEFWEQNIDLQERRNLLAPLVSAEKLEPVSPPIVPVIRVKQPESALHRLLRLITLNGHILPSFLIRRSNQAVLKLIAPLGYSTFLRQTVYVYYEEDSTGFQLNHNKKWFFRNCSTAVKLTLKTLISGSSLRGKVPELEAMMTRSFWDKQYEDNSES